MKYITPQAQLSQRREVHPSQRQHHVEPVSSPLYVVTSITNPERYYSRYKLFRAFEKYVEESGALLYTIELAFRDRHHEVTSFTNPHHIQLRSPSQIWHKENLLNIAMQRLPADAEYIAWVDADVTFARPDWATETIHQLQHFQIVQMFSHAQDVSPNHDLGNGRILNKPQQSFLCSYVIGEPLPDYLRVGDPNCQSYGSYPAGQLWHSGYAWAARRSALNDLGGLGDIGLLGSGDHHMAAALIGKVQNTIHGSMHPNFKKYWMRWQDRATTHIQRNIGYVPGLLLHYWHGSKASRKYVDRWKILVDEKFDPELDLSYDFQGVLQLTGRNPKLRDKVREYFRVRDEDSAHVE